MNPEQRMMLQRHLERAQSSYMDMANAANSMGNYAFAEECLRHFQDAKITMDRLNVGQLRYVE